MEIFDPNYPQSTWRLIIDLPASGEWNMAVDEALLSSISEGDSLPILRLYAWNPACLSLGYAQPITDVDLNRLTQLGWDLVRRPTGGRAILHTDELTYSVIAPYSEPRLEGGVLESYLRLSQALVMALHHLEIPVTANHMNPSLLQNQPKGPVCFEVPSNYEITLEGKKLVGSAQARRKEGILQHGTLPLWGDLTRILEVLNFDSEQNRQRAGEKLLQRATNLELFLNKKLAWITVVDAFIWGFTRALNLKFLEIPLTELEKELALNLVKAKYAHQTWTERM
jgi:lipoyl(octanoyl) transferase